jgi:hypothetical protein
MAHDFSCYLSDSKSLRISLRLPGRIWQFTLVLIALLGLVSVAHLGSAQTMTANVVGTVTDPGGALVPTASVTIRSLDTGEARTTATNGSGDYAFNLLPIGHYTLKASAGGFKDYIISNFELHVGDRVRLNIQMEVGTAVQTIEVTAEQAGLQTEESTVGSTLGGTTVQDLPLNGRNFMGMVILTAGVQGETTQGNWSYLAGGRVEDRRTGDSISANGKSDQLNNNEVDGFDNNDRAEGIIGLRPSIDGIQEVKVDTSSYAAENGRSAGAISNIITKSGTNTWHGSAYEYLRNDALDAWEYFAKHGAADGLHKPELRLNEFGGSLGGPIIKNKTFFFADIEEDRQVQSLIYPVIIPSKQELTPVSPGCYDYSDMDPATGVLCVSDTNPVGPVNTVGPKYYSLFPASRALPVVQTANGPEYQDVEFEPNKIQNSTTVDARIDHQFNAKDLFFARYAYNPVTTLYPGPLPAAGGLFPNGNLQSAPGNAQATAQQMQLTYTHVFNNRLIGELKAGYTRVNIDSIPPNEHLTTPADQTLGLPSGIYNITGQPSTNGMTGLNLGSNSDSAFLGDPPSEPFHNKSNNYQVLGSITYTKGAHNLKFGFGDIFRHIQYVQTGFPMGMFIMNTGANAALPFEGILTDTPLIEARMNELIQPLYRTSEPGGYALDNWRVNKALTLNLGVRYEIFTPYTEAHGQYSNFDLSTLGFICGKVNSECSGAQSASLGVTTDYKDVSPRVGFTYALNSKTVVRGAFGMSYFPPDVGNVAAGPNLVQMANAPYFFNYFSNPGPGGQCIAFEFGPSEPSSNGACSHVGPPFFPNPIMIGMQAPALYPTSSWLTNPQVTGLYAKDKNLRSSYLEQYNLSLQRTFGTNSITLAYVGDIGQALLRQTNADEPMPVACTGNDPMTGLPYNANDPCASPTYVYGAPSAPGAGPIPAVVNTQTGYATGITHTYNGASEHYDALQVVFNRQVAKGLAAGANYVWAHALTNATFGRSNITAGLLRTDPHYDYGNADLDIRQRVTFHTSYFLPFGASSNGVTAVLVKGWQANLLGYYQTGMPFTVVSQAQTVQGGRATGMAYINLPPSSNTGASTDRPNSTGKTKLSNAGVAEWFNTSAFTPQAIGTAGNEGVNQIVGPRDRRLDFSMMKDTVLRENMRLEFRAEFFNITNTENFNPPNATITGWNSNNTPIGQNLGQITSSAFSENPRQIQFALKLLF